MSASAPKLHLDADASSKALQQALLNRGLDVTRTPNEWIRADASDEQQLLGATAQGRCDFYLQHSRFSVPCETIHPPCWNSVSVSAQFFTARVDRIAEQGVFHHNDQRMGRPGALVK